MASLILGEVYNVATDMVYIAVTTLVSLDLRGYNLEGNVNSSPVELKLQSFPPTYDKQAFFSRVTATAASLLLQHMVKT